MASDADDEAEDRAAILGRRALLVSAALAGAGAALLGDGDEANAQRRAPPGPSVQAPCLSPRRPPVRAGFIAPGRIMIPVARVPQAIRLLCERQMIYAAGGGITSSPWRVQVSPYGHLLVAEGGPHGAPSTGQLATGWIMPLPDAQLRDLFALADRVWSEHRPPVGAVIADYDEVLVFLDLEHAYMAQGFGPMRGGLAEELVGRLRAVANQYRPATVAPG